MHYTYILESHARPGEHYIGHTCDIRKRLKEHNAGPLLPHVKILPSKPLPGSGPTDTLNVAEEIKVGQSSWE